MSRTPSSNPPATPNLVPAPEQNIAELPTFRKRAKIGKLPNNPDNIRNLNFYSKISDCLIHHSAV